MTYSWKDVWERKGQEVDCLRTANGWEETQCNSRDVYEAVSSQLNMKKNSSVLEVGCGAGYLSKVFIEAGHPYHGVDLSESSIKLAKEKVAQGLFEVSHASDLDFENSSFDYVICYSVFQYFPDLEYANKCLNEMCRVSRFGVYIGDLVERSKRDEHLKFTREQFLNEWKISEGVYTPERFNIYKGT